MSHTIQVVLACLVVVAVAVITGCVASYVVLQIQASQARIVATLDHRDTRDMVAQQPREPAEPKAADEETPKPDTQQGGIDMGPFQWSHFLTCMIFVLTLGATALGWLLGQKQDKSACEKRHGIDGQRWVRIETRQDWIIDALRRIADNGGPGKTVLPDPPSHPDIARELD